MGINSTEVAYGFGQIGSGFCDSAGAFTPPSGKVIIAITFLDDMTLSGLVADTSGHDATPVAGNVGYFSHTTPVAVVHGAGSDATDVSQSFPAGLTIFGRWTSVTINSPAASNGIICYFGN